MTDVTIPSLFGSASMTHHDGRQDPPAKRKAKGRGKTRFEDDFYPTPRWQTDHLLDRLDLAVPPGNFKAGCRCDGEDQLGQDASGKWIRMPRHERGCPGLRPPRILEPCVGAGNIVNAIRDRYPEAEFWTNDLDPRHEATSHFDATFDWPNEVGWPARTIQDDRLARPDWVITNPPFDAAFEIVRQAVDVALVGVAMLLRITWLEPLKTGPKGPWLAAHPPKWQLTLERYSYRQNGDQDSATTAWYVWAPALETRIEIIPGRGKQEGML